MANHEKCVLSLPRVALLLGAGKSDRDAFSSLPCVHMWQCDKFPTIRSEQGKVCHFRLGLWGGGLLSPLSLSSSASSKWRSPGPWWSCFNLCCLLETSGKLKKKKDLVAHFDANYIDLRYGASNSLSSPDVALKGFPGGSDGKESTWSVGDLGLIPGLGWSPGGGHGNPL